MSSNSEIEDQVTTDQDPGPLRIVGIAASAGGLEATSLLVQNLKASDRAAYVIAQHMSPTHKSLLTSLISRETSLPVVELIGSTIPEPGTIYVTPPNSDVVFHDGSLTLMNPIGHPATPKPSADRLFQSLADSCGENCVGIVLSGTGSDGSYGIRAIREAGGVTIAQETSSAKYDGMPASAIATGCIDLTMTPERIGQHFERILSQPRNLDSLRIDALRPSRLADLLQILLARTGVDFRGYKESTVNRRIARRMAALSIENYADYVDHCRTSQEEVDALYKDLLISVTRFFRDPRQFDQLKIQIDTMVEQESRRQLRVWVAGCATGEEAYSIAILLAEALGGPAALKKSQVQIFATDIDERALDVARIGVYPVSAAQDIPSHLLARYFEINGNELKVARELRDVMLFSRHNIFQDPPFINLDLVSIRNLLIYFEAPLQERVLYRIHYAMAPDGLLFLGTSETVGSLEAHFEPRAGTEKIFSKRRTGRVTNYRFPDIAAGGYRQGLETQDTNKAAQYEKNNEGSFESLIKAVAPQGFIATRNGDIVRIIGDISAFIELSEHGPLAMNTRLLRKPLRDQVVSLMAISFKASRARQSPWHEFELPGSNRVRFHCYPMSNGTGNQDNCLISIETQLEDRTPVEREELNGDDRDYIERMEADMRATQEALQQTVEELQTTNEELQSVNEEMQSTNEELQATNEELETSNEELQSANEELITVNEELQINSAELQAVLADLDAILKDSPFIVLAVDPALMVRRASDLARRFFGIGDIPATGLHLSQLVLPEGFPNLSAPAAEVFSLRQPKELAIDTDTSNFRLSLAPYSDSKKDLSGLTISVVDREVASIREIAHVMDSLTGQPHWRYNIGTDTLVWSRQVYELHGRDTDGDWHPTVAEAIGSYQGDERRYVRSVFDKATTTGRPFSYEASLELPDGTARHVRARGAVLRDGQGNPAYVIGTFADISDELLSEMQLLSYEDMQEDLQAGFYAYDVSNTTTYWSAKMYNLFGYNHRTYRPRLEDLTDLVTSTERERIAALLKKSVGSVQPFEFKAGLADGDGRELYCEGRLRKTGNGRVTHIYGSLRLLPGNQGGAKV